MISPFVMKPGVYFCGEGETLMQQFSTSTQVQCVLVWYCTHQVDSRQSLWQMNMQMLRKWRENTSPQSERLQLAQALKYLGLGRVACTIDERGTSHTPCFCSCVVSLTYLSGSSDHLRKYFEPNWSFGIYTAQFVVLAIAFEPSFPFQILSCSFGESKSCETKPVQV